MADYTINMSDANTFKNWYGSHYTGLRENDTIIIKFWVTKDTRGAFKESFNGSFPQLNVSINLTVEVNGDPQWGRTWKWDQISLPFFDILRYLKVKTLKIRGKPIAQLSTAPMYIDLKGGGGSPTQSVAFQTYDLSELDISGRFPPILRITSAFWGGYCFNPKIILNQEILSNNITSAEYLFFNYDSRGVVFDSIFKEYDWSNILEWHQAFAYSHCFKELTLPIFPRYSWELKPDFRGALEPVYIGKGLYNIPPRVDSDQYQDPYDIDIWKNGNVGNYGPLNVTFANYPYMMEGGNFGDLRILSDIEYFSVVDTPYIIKEARTKVVATKFDRIGSDFGNVFEIDDNEPLTIILENEKPEEFQAHKTELETNYSNYALRKKPIVKMRSVYLFKRTDGVPGVNINTFMFRRTI